jgi:hypothetical protein
MPQARHRRRLVSWWMGGIVVLLGAVGIWWAVRPGDDTTQQQWARARHPEAADGADSMARPPLHPPVVHSESSRAAPKPRDVLRPADATGRGDAKVALLDPAAEAFRAELDGYVREGREPEFIAAVAAALDRRDYSATTRWNIYVLRHIGTDDAESVLHDALRVDLDKKFPDIDDRLSVVASAFDALEDIVGREERLDMTGRYVTALEDAIANTTMPHVAIHAARIHLTHAENREEARAHLAALLGEDRAWILDIEDRVPAPLPETP